MLAKLPKVLIVAMLCFSIGLHWALLQSVAWVGMVVSYSRDGSIKEALSKTFDGNHPCKLCRVVAKGKKAGSKREPQTPIKKLDLFCGAASLVVCAPALCPLSTASPRVSTAFIEVPPKPPPRSLLG